MKKQIAEQIKQNEQKLFLQYLNYEENRPNFDSLDKVLQEYIRSINSEYKNFIAGKLPFDSLSMGAQHKSSNKVTRAYLRRELVDVNKQIRHMAKSTDGYGLLSYQKHTYDSVVSSVYNGINEVFSYMFRIEYANDTMDYLNISGLTALITFKEYVIDYMDNNANWKSPNKNSKELDNAIRMAKHELAVAINKKEIDVDEVDYLRNPVTATKAKSILNNISEADLNKCLEVCNYNKNPFPEYTTSTLEDDTIKPVSESYEEVNSNQPKQYFTDDSIFPLTERNGKFYLGNEEYRGNVVTYNADYDDFEPYDTEIDIIKQNIEEEEIKTIIYDSQPERVTKEPHLTKNQKEQQINEKLYGGQNLFTINDDEMGTKN